MGNDNNPLAPFTNLFEAFDTGSDVLTAMGPLSPLSLAGGGGTASPEEGTKRAIRQLYAVLVGLDEGSMDTWKQLFDTATFDGPFSLEAFTGVAETTYRVWFHGLAQLLVESFTLRIVHEELVADGHRHTTETGRWLWRMPQADREQLLLRCTDVDDDLVSEMQEARRHRDELLYDFGSWGEADAKSTLADARQHLEVLTALERQAVEGSVFTYFPSDAAE